MTFTMNSCMSHENLKNQITLLSAAAAKLPGVVIVHNIHDWKVTWLSNYGLKGPRLSLGEVTAKAEYLT